MPRVDQIDHVEIFVPDRYEAAEWYARTLGLEIVRDFEFWATEGGPLMIASRGAGTKIALFEGEPQGERPSVGYRRTAFRTDGESFLEFVRERERLPDCSVVVDHGKAFSIYFHDPWGHPLEITTYDCEAVAKEHRRA